MLYWETPPWLSNPPLPFLTEEVPPEGQKARNSDRTRMFTKAEWLKSKNLTIFSQYFSNKTIWKKKRLYILSRRWWTWRKKWQRSYGGNNCCQTSCDVCARWLTEINSFSFKSNLLGISFGTRTSKSDLLQKITKMVVECSCVAKKIVGKDARRRKTTLPWWVCTLPIITHFFSADSLWIHNLSGKSLV